MLHLPPGDRGSWAASSRSYDDLVAPAPSTGARVPQQGNKARGIVQQKETGVYKKKEKASERVPIAYQSLSNLHNPLGLCYV